MPLFLEDPTDSSLWTEPTPRKEPSTPSWRPVEKKPSKSANDDLYREDHYRFEGDPWANQEHCGDDLRRIDYLPTPAEISGECARIRATWTRSEKRRRYVGELPPSNADETNWAPPVIDMSHFRAAATSACDAV